MRSSVSCGQPGTGHAARGMMQEARNMGRKGLAGFEPQEQLVVNVHVFQ